jgi:hypothetical protein
MCNVTKGHSIACLAFWKFSGAILSSTTIFFNGPITQAWVYFAFNICSYKRYVTASLFLCRSSSRGLVIGLPITFSFLLSFVHFLQHFIFVLVYHILWSHIFHNVNAVILLMIWGSTCYIIRVRVNAL